jgi:hypothetical protein
MSDPRDGEKLRPSIFRTCTIDTFENILEASKLVHESMTPMLSILSVVANPACPCMRSMAETPVESQIRMHSTPLSADSMDSTQQVWHICTHQNKTRRLFGYMGTEASILAEVSA